MAAKDALKLQQDAGDERGSIVKAIMQDAQREILERILLGAWMGTVDPLFGGYEQLFEYKAENPKVCQSSRTHILFFCVLDYDFPPFSFCVCL